MSINGLIELENIFNKKKEYAKKKRKEQLNSLIELNRIYLSKNINKKINFPIKMTTLNMKLYPPKLPFSKHYIHTNKSIILSNNIFHQSTHEINYIYNDCIFEPFSIPINNELEINKLLFLIICNNINQEILLKIFILFRTKQIIKNIPEILIYLSKKTNIPIEWILEIWYQNSIYYNYKFNKNSKQMNYNLCDVCWLFNCNEHLKFIRWFKIGYEMPFFISLIEKKEILKNISFSNKKILKTLIKTFDNNNLIIKLFNLITNKFITNEIINKINFNQNIIKKEKIIIKKIYPTIKYTQNNPIISPPPCLHDGLCLNNSMCSCFLNSIYCGNRCGCIKCNIKFPTCNCNDCNINCFCIKNSISCNNCNCNNCFLKDFIEKDLEIKNSIVQGLGLFSSQLIKKKEFIIEYTGEIIDFNTTETRGKIYEQFKCSYIFDLSSIYKKYDTSIDAMFLGNKSRFINHSDTPNIEAKTIKDNEKYKILFFAIKDIQIGEELFFTYNYEEESKIKFGF